MMTRMKLASTLEAAETVWIAVLISLISESVLLGTLNWAQESIMIWRFISNRVLKDVHFDSSGQPSDAEPVPRNMVYWLEAAMEPEVSEGEALEEV